MRRRIKSSKGGETEGREETNRGGDSSKRQIQINARQRHSPAKKETGKDGTDSDAQVLAEAMIRHRLQKEWLLERMHRICFSLESRQAFAQSKWG